MSPHTLRDDELSFSTDGGKLLVSVPWDSAPALQERLRVLGVESTLFLDAGRHRAALMPCEVLSESRVRSLLAVEDEELPRW